MLLDIFSLFRGRSVSSQVFSSFGTSTCGGCYGYGIVSHYIEEKICSDSKTTHTGCVTNGYGGQMAAFSFDKSHLDPGSVDTDFTTGSLVVVAGGRGPTYTSPTVYLNIGRFTWNDVYLLNGQCFTNTVYPVTLSSVFRYTVPTGKPATDVLRSAEIEFVESILSTSSYCSIAKIVSPGPTPTPSARTPQTTSNSSTSLTFSTTLIPSTTSVLPTASPSSLNASTGLSTSSKIGIVIGAGIGGAILLVLLAFFIWKRRHSKAGQVLEERPTIHEADGRNNVTTEVEGKTLNEADSKTVAVEKDGQLQYELVGNIPIVELSAGNEMLPDRQAQG